MPEPMRDGDKMAAIAAILGDLLGVRSGYVTDGSSEDFPVQFEVLDSEPPTLYLTLDLVHAERLIKMIKYGPVHELGTEGGPHA